MQYEINLQKLAEEIKAVQDRSRQIEPFTSRFGDFGNAEAYAVAHLVHEMRISEGTVPVGRKIGFTNPEMWSIYGVREPIWAYIYDSTIVQLTSPQAQCHIEPFIEPKIEPEIVIHFRSAPPLSDDLTQILQCVDWVAHGIEIVQCHFPSWKFQAADAIADWALHGRLLVGEPQDVNRLGPTAISDLERFMITLSCGGEVRATGRGFNVLGSPLKAIAHLTTAIAKQPHASPLQAGEVVTTGTLTPALAIHAGQSWNTNLKGIALPGISLSIEM